MVQFNPRSQSRLQGVDPRLVQVLNLAKQQSGLNFEISEGLRDTERQKKLVAEGKSQTLNSRHLHGKAVDVHLLNDDGTANWDFNAYEPLAVAMKSAAQELGYDDLVWGGDWKTLKDGVHFQIGGPEQAASPGPSVIGRGSNAQVVQGNQVSRAADGLLGGQQMAEQPQQRGLRGLLSDPDKRDRLILALEGMTLNPNTALQQAAAQGLQERGQQRQQQAQAGRTADFLRARGRADLADAVEAGLPAADALRTALSGPSQQKGVEINGRLVNPVTGEVIADFGQDVPASFRALELRAERAGLQPGTEAYSQFMIDQGKKEGLAVSVGADGQVQVTTGGIGIPQTKGQTELDKAAAKDLNEFIQGGAADASKNLAQLQGVRQRIASGEAGNVSGPLVGSLPRAVIAATNPEALDLREQVEEVVQRNLRAVLGAQFTQAEGERLISRAYNPLLPEETNVARLDRLIAQMDSALKTKASAAEYFRENGTLTGWPGKLPTIDDFTFDDAPKEQAEPAPGQVTNATGNIAVDPELLQFMTPEERALFE